MSTQSPCMSCKHYRGDKKVDRRDNGGVYTDVISICAAFPEGIPDEILFNEDWHRDPFEGDHGIQWQPTGGFEYLDVPETFYDDKPDPKLTKNELHENFPGAKA